MKKCILTLLTILLLSCSVFAGREVVVANLTTDVTGSIAAPVGVPSVGSVDSSGKGYYIFFRTSGGYEFIQNGEGADIRVEEASPYNGGSVPLDIFYKGNEADVSHKLIVEVYPWKKVVPDANFNNITASFSASPTLAKALFNATYSKAAVSKGKKELSMPCDTLTLNLDVLSNVQGDMEHKIGTLDLAWVAKQIGAGDYVATIKISVEGN